jgi:threonine dehydrogenase-like Zn-dependent dehydrogenase
MRIAEIEEPRKISIKERTVKKSLQKNEILISVAFCGICGTDRHIYEGGVPFVKYPIVPGHEFSGTVVEIGSNVKKLSIGDRVAVNPNLSCKDKEFSSLEYCYYCKKHRPHFCTNWEAIGVTKPGAFAEYVITPDSSAFKIPAGVSLKEGALMEPIACCLHGINKLNISSEDTILIIGAGPIGLLMVGLIKSLFGSTIIVSEVLESRLNLAKNLGANYTVNPTRTLLEEFINDLTDGFGLDISIECVGSLKSAEDAVKYLNRGGKALLFGVTNEHLNLDLFQVYSKEIAIFGSFTNPNENKKSLQILKDKLFQPLDLISHEFPLEKLEYGLRLMDFAEEKIK